MELLSEFTIKAVCQDSNVFRVTYIDLKVETFNSIIVDILDEFMPLRSVRIHPSDKPWITGYIKTQIKARQLAFTRGDKTAHKFMCEKVSTLISRAKATYYQTRMKDLRSSNPEKWFKTIYALVGDHKGVSNSFSPSTEDLTDVAEKL